MKSCLNMRYKWRELQKYLFLWSIIAVIHGQQPCPPPDVPINGTYRPRKKEYKPQDEVIYTCDGGFTRVGKEKRTCMLDRKWSDTTPFCDFPARTKNPHVDRDPVLAKRVIDGNINTCYNLSSIDSKLKLYLAEEAPVYAVKIYFNEGPVHMKIMLNPYNTTCTTFDRTIEYNNWTWLPCEKNDYASSYLEIRGTDATRKNITLCEIEVFVKRNNMCDLPPDRSISNGRLVVSRNKADLECDPGYKDKNGRLVCENNIWRDAGPVCEEITCDPIVSKMFGASGTGEWSFLDQKKIFVGTSKELKCTGDFEIAGGPTIVTCLKDGTWTKTNATCIEKQNKKKIIAAVVGSLVAFIILVLLGIMFFLLYKQRNREVVVVFKPSDDGSSPAGSELQYSTALYETIHHPPIPPSTARPTILPPIFSETYGRTADKNTYKTRTMPADIAFGTLKPSTLYGS